MAGCTISAIYTVLQFIALTRACRRLVEFDAIGGEGACHDASNEKEKEDQ
ncbi:MAG: hypothetical protein AAF394_14155 [Planctomycetota bacterium]